MFLTGTPDYVPTSLLHNLKHNKVLHERVVFVTVLTLDVPEAAHAERMSVEELSPGVHRVTLRYGFMESPNIPRALEELRTEGFDYDPMQASFFLGREVLVRAMVPKLPKWRLFLFLLMARNSVPGDGVLPHPERSRGRTGRAGRDLVQRFLRTAPKAVRWNRRTSRVFSVACLSPKPVAKGDELRRQDTSGPILTLESQALRWIGPQNEG